MDTLATHQTLYTHAFIMPQQPLTFIVPLTPHLSAPAVLSPCSEITLSLLLGAQKVVIAVRVSRCVCVEFEEKRTSGESRLHGPQRWTASWQSSVPSLHLSLSLSRRMEAKKTIRLSSDSVARVFVQAALFIRLLDESCDHLLPTDKDTSWSTQDPRWYDVILIQSQRADLLEDVVGPYATSCSSISSAELFISKSSWDRRCNHCCLELLMCRNSLGQRNKSKAHRCMMYMFIVVFTSRQRQLHATLLADPPSAQYCDWSTHSKKDPGSKLLVSWCLSVWSLHVLLHLCFPVVRLTGDSKLPTVWLIACLYESALWQTDSLSRVYPWMTAGKGFSTPATL